MFVYGYHYILGLAGMELTFFTAACMVLHFGFVAKTVLIIQGCLDVLAIAEQYLHSISAFPVSHTAPPARRLGVHKELRGDTARTADPD